MNQAKLSHRKKRLILIALVFFGFLVFLGVIYFLFIRNSNGNINLTSKDPSIQFSSENYDDDIFSDPIYLAQQREILYTEYGTGELLTKDSATTEQQLFFLNYFETVVQGKYKEYNQYFTNRYCQDNVLPERFTMQKLYDISVDLYATSAAENNETRYIYVVRYKIMNNNGSFRGDVASDTIRPLVFTLLKNENNRVLIDAIGYINSGN